MQQERHQVEANGLEGWRRFLQNEPLHKRESMGEKMPFPFALWRCFDEVVEGKRNPVYQAGVGAQSFERAHHTMVDQTWLLF